MSVKRTDDIGCNFLLENSWHISILKFDDDYVDVVRPRLWTAATNLHIVRLQVIYEQWEPWRNDFDRGILLIHPPELSGSSTSSHLEEKQEELPKEIINVPLRSIFHTFKGSLTFRKLLKHGAEGFTSPPREGVLRIFIALRRGWTSEPCINGKNANQ
jgi:hypothetical protein